MNMASGFFPTITPVPVAPPPPPVLPVTNLAAAFTSVATLPPDPADFARQFLATKTLADFDTAGLQQVINTRGAPLRPTTDPLEMEISAANQLLSRVRKMKIDPKDLTGNLKINYDRAIELRKQVTGQLALDRGAKQTKKAATLATKAEKEIRRDSSLSQASTAAGSPNPETKAQKQARIKAEKIAARASSVGAAGGSI
jgi:hypothetical protein